MIFFSKSLRICGFLELVWFIAFNTESESEIIINLLLVLQVLMKSKARSTAFALLMKFDEASGFRYILLLLSDITTQQTF